MTTEHEQRLRVVESARNWLGTPYHHRGAQKGVGTDCGMSLICIFSDAGVIDYFDPGPYPPDWMLHRDEQQYLGIVERFAHHVDNPGLGDIALFQFGRCISHGGVLVGKSDIVHAYKPAGSVTIDNIENNTQLASRLVGYWSVWGA
jgi:cell wall-associated NlpC family hydrolase